MTWFGGREAAERAKRAVHSKRRALREKAATPEGASPISLDSIWERDRVGDICYCVLCKLPVHREDASLEHIEALANGGAHDESNVGIAHGPCNSAKGDRAGPRKKGLRRRAPLRRKRPVLATRTEDGEEIF